MRRISSLRVANGKVTYTSVNANEGDSKLVADKDITINIGEQNILDSNKNQTLLSSDVIEQSTEYINDYIFPEMNYKDHTSCKSPPVVTIKDFAGVTWNAEKDDISLYGTPKEEMLPGFSETKVPSFMRSQIEALFQPSGQTSALFKYYQNLM